MNINPGVLAASAIMTVGGAIAISYQPPVTLVSRPYTSIQEAVQPPANPFFKGVGSLMIVGGAIAGAFAYTPKQEKQAQETTKTQKEQEDEPWQTQQSKGEEEELIGTTAPLPDIFNSAPPFTAGSRPQPTSPSPIDLWDEVDSPTHQVKLEKPNPFTRLDEYPTILIYGPQGSGKTSVASQLVRRRVDNGHTVMILDPHKRAGQWEGLECFGSGMDYAEIDERLAWFHQEIESRYKQAAIDIDFNPFPVTLVCDEFTNWASRCRHAADFFMAACTDIRKINLSVIFIAHNRTLQALGNAQGMAAVRDSGLAELELLVQIDPITGKASPRLEGLLKMPGGSLEDRQTIKIPKMDVSFNFSEKKTQKKESNVIDFQKYRTGA